MRRPSVENSASSRQDRRHAIGAASAGCRFLAYWPMISLALIAYISACLLTGYYGRQRRLGFIGSTLLSFFITPLLLIAVLFLTAPTEPAE